jgi:WD40 repeat protein
VPTLHSIRAIKEDLAMQGDRVHLVNSEFALLALRSTPLHFFPATLFLWVVASSILWAQLPAPPDTSSIANPFRTSSTGVINKGTAIDSNTRSLESISGSSFADVIQLDRLPSNRERPVVTAISVSPRGEFLAAAGDDHAIRIVSMETGKTLSTLLGHLDWVQSLEFSPDGKRLASCSNDGSIRLWSVEAKPRMLTLKSVEHALLTLAFLDDNQIYVAGFGNNIYRMDLAVDKLTIDHACECNDIRSIACSPDGKWMAYGGRDGVLRIRSTDIHETSQLGHSHADGELIAPLHFDRIRSIQFSDDSQQLTSVGEDRRIVHYDMDRRKAVGQTVIGGGKLMGLCQLEPHLFAIAGSDNTIRIFSETDKRVLVKLVGHDGSVSILKRTGNHIVSGSFDTTIRVWDIDRAMSGTDSQGRYIHPVAAQFEDSGAGDNVK